MWYRLNNVWYNWWADTNKPCCDLRDITILYVDTRNICITQSGVLMFGYTCKNWLSQKQCYIKSFFPSTIKELTMLPIAIRNYRSPNVFERKLKLHPPHQPKWHGSVLVKDLWIFAILEYVYIYMVGANWKHIYISISMWKMMSCGCWFGIEDPYHFLFTCPLYAQRRLVMLDSIAHIHVAPDNILGISQLRGDINLTLYQYKAIFEYVQAFIRTSTRF